MKSRRHPLPLIPLLRAFAARASCLSLETLPTLGARCVAIRTAATGLLSDSCLSDASVESFDSTLRDFYQACVHPALHTSTLGRRAAMVRHSLAHVKYGRDPLPMRLARCLQTQGEYFIPGLGLSFWSAIAQALDPVRQPGATLAILAGVRRLGLARWPAHADAAAIHRVLVLLYDRLRTLEPELSTAHLDYFLTLVSLMDGRNLWSGSVRLSTWGAGLDAGALIRAERSRLSLRLQLKERGKTLAAARSMLEEALRTQRGEGFREALSVADPEAVRRAPLSWDTEGENLALWVGRFWEAEDPQDLLKRFWSMAPISGAGLWLPAAVLHLRDPRRYLPWGEEVRQGLERIEDGCPRDLTPVLRYELANEAAQEIVDRHRLHPLEMPVLLARLAGRFDRNRAQDRGSVTSFRGFCDDSFVFFKDLESHNNRAWMRSQRDRYRFAVRQPLVELCRTLGERYLEPVLQRTHGWEMETRPRTGHALTGIGKPEATSLDTYHTALCITFHRRRDLAGTGPDPRRREEAQLFVRLDASGLTYGLRLDREARVAGRALRRSVQELGTELFTALCASGAAAECRFVADSEEAIPLQSAADLRTWATGKTLQASKHLPPDHALLASDDLVGEILLTLDRLLPAYACTFLDEPRAFLSGRAAAQRVLPRYSEDNFCKDTLLSPGWLNRARELLALKKQLILQGIPGTGKTHVARALARFLTQGREDGVRLVQFHPAYSYEEFVEGLKVKSIDSGGRQEVIYPVEEGLLCSLASEAERRPTEPFVLVIDEINRGNLPRIFGELLYLLEYRGQSLTLPTSRRAFRLPENLYLLGTMNAADRSITLLDQALRRRFSFLEMLPDETILKEWLRLHPPQGGSLFAEAVLGFFHRLNQRLHADFGPERQIGHTLFMVPHLDLDRLRVIWEHHVVPLLHEAFQGHGRRETIYDFDDLFHGENPTPRQRMRTLR